jgi:hypothetical protein
VWALRHVCEFGHDMRPIAQHYSLDSQPVCAPVLSLLT